MIICAALLIENKETCMQEILPCRRHGDGLAFFHNVNLNIKWKVIGQGFINHNGTYLDREDALSHAIECGQLSATTREYKQEHFETRELYSEDLY